MGICFASYIHRLMIDFCTVYLDEKIQFSLIKLDSNGAVEPKERQGVVETLLSVVRK